ncbi:MAG: hypothetical protein KDB23_26090 [Planctomycetales bacterium]|nr:hypothetical protein [Planctomycetales bacterium]
MASTLRTSSDVLAPEFQDIRRVFLAEIIRVPGIRFGSGTALLITGLTALLLASFLQRLTWLTILTMNVVGILTAAELLVYNLPRRLQEAIVDNCYRSNGSWSERRCQIERSAVRRYRRHVILSLAIVSASVHVGLVAFDQGVLPLHTSIALMQTDPAADNSDIVDNVDREWSEWLGANRQQQRRRLGRLSPVLWTSLIIGILILTWLIKNAYVWALRQLASSIHLRSEQYRLNSFSRILDCSSN